jgi:glutathione S-transferase
MQLLYTKRSPYARKAQVMALEKAIPLTLVAEDLMNKSPQLLAANPIGKVPALILENGQTLFDSPVICEYIDSLNNNPVLITPENRWQILRWQALADGLMDNMVGMYLEKMRHPQDFNAKFIRNQENNSTLVLNYCQQHLAELADLSLASIAVACAIDYVNFRFPQLNEPGLYPDLQGWFSEFSKRPSMQATIPTV